jgi:hydrogenase maturation protein HypF
MQEDIVQTRIRVEPPSPKPILAVGGELKSAVCLLRDDQAFLSETIGALSDPACFRSFLENVKQMQGAQECEPGLVACDMHPEYAATRFARSLDLPCVEVQHHHAHIASCAAEHNILEPVIGLACDGTGYGTDGAIWGCEVLVCHEESFSRTGHLDYFDLPGGDAAAIDTWRPAAGLLHKTFGETWLEEAGDLFTGVDPDALRLTAQRLKSGSPLPRTSSLGRLFDAAAFLLGLCSRNDQEAQAAMALEAAAEDGNVDVEAFPCNWLQEEGDESLRLDVRPIVTGLIHGLREGRSIPDQARKFHRTLAQALVTGAKNAHLETGVRKVALSGGCFFNRILRDEVMKGLAAAKPGFDVMLHERTSFGDGSIALGQAVIAAWMKRKELC